MTTYNEADAVLELVATRIKKTREVMLQFLKGSDFTSAQILAINALAASIAKELPREKSVAFLEACGEERYETAEFMIDYFAKEEERMIEHFAKEDKEVEDFKARRRAARGTGAQS